MMQENNEKSDRAIKFSQENIASIKKNPNTDQIAEFFPLENSAKTPQKGYTENEIHTTVKKKTKCVM